MNKGITTVSVASLRAAATEKSELMSQALFGESFEILEAQQDFTKVKMDFDGFEAWISNLQYKAEIEIPEREVLTAPYLIHQGKLLSLGSELSGFLTESPATKENLEKTALSFLNVPFLSGGRSYFGTDSAGFIQLIFKAIGLKLPRLAHEQINFGEVLAFVEESETGDLAFFDNEEGEIVHVGMMLENFKVLHCFGSVRTDQLDSTGIYNQELGKYTHKLRFIKRILKR